MMHFLYDSIITSCKVRSVQAMVPSWQFVDFLFVLIVHNVLILFQAQSETPVTQLSTEWSPTRARFQRATQL